MSDGGKGSSPRPVDQKKYNDNWEIIFGKNKKPIEGIQVTNVELDSGKISFSMKEKQDE
jgi:hypothetical protein